MGHRCIACGEPAGYNRAVVDTVGGVRVGALCVNCERAEFGRSLERGRWRGVDGCAFCDRDGFYALPQWVPDCRRDDAALVSTVAYEVTEATATVCDEHLHALRDDPPRDDRTRK